MSRAKVALVWHGDAEVRRTADLDANRLGSVAAVLRDAGIEPQPAVYSDQLIDEVRTQLMNVDGALVWVNPIEAGEDRSNLNALLREVAAQGVFVSAHPDIIESIGTKEVLYRTRDHAWGSDTRLYESLEQLTDEFPHCLAEGAARVLKRSHGHSGNGVWKVELADQADNATSIEETALVRVRHAARGASEQVMTLADFMAGQADVFSRGGSIVDQIYQPRLVEGMVRCYLVGDRVVGFGEQLINALYPAPRGRTTDAAPQPGPRLYYSATRPDLQLLKEAVEAEWLPELCASQDIDSGALPVIWDLDFLHGPATTPGTPDYVLCEINVSSVFPFPDDALIPMAHEIAERLGAR